MVRPATDRRRPLLSARRFKANLHLEFLEDRTLLDAGQLLYHPEAVLRVLHSPTDTTPKAVPPGGSTLPPPTPANVLVNDPGEDGTSAQDTQSETSLVVAGTDVLAGFNDSLLYNGSSNLHFTGFAHSTDSGDTFQDLGALPNTPGGDGGDPALARDNVTGRTYLVTLSLNNPSIPLFRSDDNFATFLPVVNAAPGHSGLLDKEWIAVDNAGGAGQGNVYVVVRDFGSGNGIYLSRSTDHGDTFGPSGGVQIVSAGSGNVQGAWVTTGPDHAVYVFWFDNVTSTQKIMMRKSTDQGQTFGPAVTVATLHTTGVNGDLNLGGFRSNAFAQAVVNPINNNIYVTFDDKGAGSDRADVFFTQSTDGGTTWATPVKVNDDTTTRDQWQPAIAVTPNGSKVGIFWYDRRNDPANTMIDRFGAIGTVSGSTVTFAANMQITDMAFPPAYGHDPVVNPVYMGDYDSVAATDSFFYLTWGDNRSASRGHTGNNADVRFARIPLEVAGPSVIASRFSGTAVGNLNTVRVSFDEEIDPDTFTPDQVLFLGPSGTPIAVQQITPVDGSGDTQFDISFATQSTLGNYLLVVGPNIDDTNGNPMDQNGNGIPGEVPGDQYVGRFTLQGPKITASTPSLSTPDMFGPVASVRVTFNESIDPTTFTPAKIASFLGPRGPITVTGVTAVTGSNNTQFDIAFAPQGSTGYYTLTIGPDIRDATGHQMDQNGNFIAGEIPDDQYIARFRLKGPAITARSPTGTSFTPGQVASFIVTFNEPMNPATFTPDTVVFTGPDGAIPVTSITPVGSSNTQFNIVFNPVGVAGHYTMVIGPNVMDLFGNPMDQNGNFFPGEIPGDQYSFAFDIAGPVILSNTPNLTTPVLGQVTMVRVTFNEPIDPTTMTPDKITSFTGPNGPIDVTGIFSVGGSNNAQFDITFAPQVTTGRYMMVFGPGILDYFGNEAASYTASFGIQGPKILSSTPSGTANLPGVVNHVRLTFNESMDPSTFTSDQVVSFTGPNGDVPINDIQPVPNTGNTQFDVSFDPLTTPGSYRLVVGPNILDLYGNAMDQNGNLVPGEVPGDEYTASFGVTGPLVTGVARNGPNSMPVSSVRVSFNEPIDPSTFTSDQVTQLEDPSGNPIDVQDVTPVTGSNNTQFDVSFDVQTAPGTYTIAIGPGIADLFGNTTTTTFTGHFVVTPHYTAGATDYEDLDIHGLPGTFRVIQYADDASAPVNLGTHTFNYYGTIYTGNNALFASSNALISFGVADSAYSNTDLTASPSEAVIAPIWSDWLKSSGTDMLEGYFDDANSRLILQWNEIQHFPSSPMGITFQVILQLDTGGAPGDIIFNYVDLDSGDGNANGATSTVGIKNTGPQGTDRVLVSFDMLNQLVGSGQAILISAASGDGGIHSGKRPGALRASPAEVLGDPVALRAEEALSLAQGTPPLLNLTTISNGQTGNQRVPDSGLLGAMDQVFASVGNKSQRTEPLRVRAQSLASTSLDPLTDSVMTEELF